jgi:hypothetical protein
MQLTPGNGYPTIPGPGAPSATKDPTPLTEHWPAVVHVANPGLSMLPFVATVQLLTPPAGFVEIRGSPPSTAATQKAVVGHEMPLTLYWLLCCANEGCGVGPPRQEAGARGSVDVAIQPPTVTLPDPPATQSSGEGQETAWTPSGPRPM